MNLFNFQTISILFLLFVSEAVYSQRNLQNAYIITLNGDSIHGFIQIKDWGMNPSRILFKTSLTDTGVYYNPYEIREFGMNNEKWRGGFVNIELSSRDEQYLSDSPDLILEADMAFLQTVIDGSKPLYVYRKSIFEQYYIENDTTFELLVYKKYKKTHMDKTTNYYWQTITEIFENNNYRIQLNKYLKDCPGIGFKTNKTSYNLKSLEKLFHEYYVCTGENYKTLTPVKNISLKFGATAGLSLTSVHFDVSEFENIKTTKFVTYPFGISFEIGRPVSLPRWKFYNEYTYVSPYLLENRERIESETGYTNIHTTYKFHSGKLLNTIRYSMIDKKIKLFGSFGLSTEFYGGTLTNSYDGIVLSTKIHNEISVRREWRAMRMIAGLGCRYSKFSFETRFEPGNSLRYVGPTTSFLLNFTF